MASEQRKGRPGANQTGKVDGRGSGLSSVHNDTTPSPGSQGLAGELFEAAIVRHKNGNDPAGNLPGQRSHDHADVEAERWLLGVLLYDPDAYEAVANTLKPEHFQDPRHSAIYRAMQTAAEDGKPLDLVTVQDALGQDKRVRNAGGASGYLDELMPDVSHVHTLHRDDYLRRILEARKLHDTRHALEDAARSGDSAEAISRRMAEIDARYRLDDDEAGPARSPYARFIVPLPEHLDELAHLGPVGEIGALVAKLVDAPASFGLLTVLSVTATAMNRRAVLRMAFGDVFPNLYTGLVGPSSVTHKTTTMAMGRRLLRMATLERFAIPANPTAEGLLNRLATVSTGLLFRDEMGTLLASHRTKYLRQLKEDLMALYSCDEYGRQLASGEISVAEPYLSILGTTTPERFFSSIGDTDWTDGFLVRWLIALPSQAPRFEVTARMVGDDDYRELHGYANTLKEMSQQEMRSWAVDADALDWWNDWRNERRKTAYDNGDGLGLALSERYATAALKLAMILAAPVSWGRINFDCMNRAIDLSHYFETCILRLKQAKDETGISGAKLQKVLRLLNDRGPLKIGEIQRYGNMSKDESGEVVDKLKEIGAIIEQPAPSGRTVQFMAITEKLPIRTW